MSWCVTAVSNGLRRMWTPAVSQVRFRYHQDKIDAGPFIRRFGYEEKVFRKGALPHVKHPDHLPGKQYCPKDSWAEKRALYGQNDYIDIFKDNMNPVKIMYEVPPWLRGFKGNEYQTLLRKRKMLGQGSMRALNPTDWRMMNKRIWYLYKFLNRKTKSYFFRGYKLGR